MSGRVRFRGVLAASVLAACAAVVLLPPAAADTGHYIYEYTCEDGALLPAEGPNTIAVDVTVPTSVRVGERLAVDWTLSESPLAASAAFKAGGRLIATGTADVKGLWEGELDATGGKDQAELAEGGPLELPAAISGSVTTTEAGKLTITPADLVLDFIPPADTVRVNDGSDPAGEPSQPGDHSHPPIEYKGQWFYSGTRAGLGDHQEDLHATKTEGDTAAVSFIGTGISYIGERVSSAGKFEVYVDGATTATATVDAHDPDSPPDKPKSQQVLWSKTDLPYGPHRVLFKNIAPAGTHMAVDAFDLITGELSTPPDYFRTTCTYTGTPKSVTVEVLPAPTPSDDDDDNDGQVTDGDDSARGVIVLSGGGQGHGGPTVTATVTRTPTPRRTPQVRVTPKGGAQTGEAPRDDTAAPLLIGYGTAMTVAGIAGGVLRRQRRRAAG